MNYYKQIDGLRFFAILLVLIEHFASIFSKYISAGYYGVDLFFVISGFLISSILLRPNDDSFKVNYCKFLGRRTLMIFPLYYLVLTTLWLLNVGDVRIYFGWLLTYTANYGMLQGGMPNAPILHLWSLSVEEQFYLFWPLVLLTFKRQPKTLMIIVFAIIFTGYAQMVFNIFPAFVKYNYWGLFTRMASLSMGALGALVYSKNLIKQSIFSNIYIEWGVILLLIISLLIKNPIKAPLMGLCSLYFVLKAAGGGFKIGLLNKILNNSWVLYIGTISYGIYIFHPVVEALFTQYIFDPIWMKIHFENSGVLKRLQWNSWVIKFPLYSFISVCISAISFKYFEKPITALKDKWF